MTKKNIMRLLLQFQDLIPLIIFEKENKLNSVCILNLIGCTGFEPVFSSVREMRPFQTGPTPD